MPMITKREPIRLNECAQAYRKETMEELQQLQRSIEAQKDEFQETKAKERSLLETVFLKLFHQLFA